MTYIYNIPIIKIWENHSFINSKSTSNIQVFSNFTKHIVIDK